MTAKVKTSNVDLRGLSDREVLETIYSLEKKTHFYRVLTLILWIAFILLPLALIIAGAFFASSFVKKIDKVGLAEKAEQVVQVASDFTGISYKIGQIDVDKVNQLLEAGEAIPRIEEKLDKILGSQVIYE